MNYSINTRLHRFLLILPYIPHHQMRAIRFSYELLFVIHDLITVFRGMDNKNAMCNEKQLCSTPPPPSLHKPNHDWIFLVIAYVKNRPHSNLWHFENHVWKGTKLLIIQKATYGREFDIKNFNYVFSLQKKLWNSQV